MIEHDPDIDNLPLLAWSQYCWVVERFGEKNKKHIFNFAIPEDLFLPFNVFPASDMVGAKRAVVKG